VYRRAVLGTLLLVVLTGCSSSHKASPATTVVTDAATTTSTLERTSVSTATTKPDAPSPTTTVPGSSSDQTIASLTVLLQSDLQGDWQSGPVQENDQSGDAELSKCLGIPDSDSKETAYAGSHRFTQGNTEIYSQATVYSSAEVVRSDFQGIQSPKLTTCLTQSAERAGVSQVHVTKAILQSLPQGMVGFVLTVSGVGNGTSVVIMQMGLGKGNVEVTLHQTSVGGSPPVPGLSHAADVLERRLDAGVS
jgi:hypothetical protein